MVFLRWTAPGGEWVVAAHNVRTGRFLGSIPGALVPATVSSPRRNRIVVASTQAPATTLLTALDPEEGLMWARNVSGTVTLESASDDTLFLRNGAQGVALDLDSGAERFRGDFAVPLAVLADGTAILPTGNQSQYLFATPTQKDRQ